MKTLPDTLFLHGGPGLHCAVERAWFGDTLPILWWDQPGVAGEPDPFRALVAHAGRQLEAMAESTGGQVNLIAHSFGGQIAAVLAREYPGLIRRITLLGSPPTPLHAFFNFARRLLENGYERPGLKDALAAAKEICDENRFAALIQACYPDSAIPAIYFGAHSAEARDRYFAVAGKTPPIDIATFFAVMREFLHAPHLTQANGHGKHAAPDDETCHDRFPLSNFPPMPSPQSSPASGRGGKREKQLLIPAGERANESLREFQINEYGGEVVMLMGRDDPLLCVEEDPVKWREVFPQLDLKLVDCGHIVHLELPPEAWCGKR